MEAEEAARRKTDDHFQRAKVAAALGQPVRALEALHNSGFLDGVTRDMKGRWQRLPGIDAEVAVAEAVESFYYAVRDGRRLDDIGAYLWKASHNAAKKLYERRLREKSKGQALGHVYGASSAPEHEDYAQEDGEDEGPGWEERRTKAIAIARELLPRLGQENVQAVMSFVIDAVEDDQLHLPNSEIAEALRLTVDTVRQCKSRGFRRLERIATEENLAEHGLDVEGFELEG